MTDENEDYIVTRAVLIVPTGHRYDEQVADLIKHIDNMYPALEIEEADTIEVGGTEHRITKNHLIALTWDEFGQMYYMSLVNNKGMN